MARHIPWILGRRPSPMRRRSSRRAVRPRHKARSTIAPIASVLLVLALAAGACSSGEPAAEPRDPSGGPPFELPDDLVLAGALAPFAACDDLLDHVKEQALEMVTPYGLGGGFGIASDGRALEETADDADEASGAGRPGEGEDFSGTNVQEAGVDEPDLVKTDGRIMYLISRGMLEVIDVTGDQPEQLTTVPIGDAWNAQLMLHGDQLLVTTASGSMIPFANEGAATTPLASELAEDSDDMAMPYGGHGSTLTSIDVSDPSDPVVQERLTLDGGVVNSRMVDGVVRVVIRTEAGINLPWEYPQTGGLRGDRAALAANRELIEGSEAEDWLPYYVHETADGDVEEGLLLACDRVAHPQDFAGLGVLSVLTVDLDSGSLAPHRDGIGVLAAGDTVYASTDHLYVATTRWIDWGRLNQSQRRSRVQEVTTELHAFDITSARAADYLGSGEVPGTLLNQWAMSEHGGHLRVASTVGDPWSQGIRAPSESLVTVLEVGEGELTEVGQVAGLGLTETIYAVRFMGDVGYVVTFRQTDPLYTLDLRDPTDPQVTGELKIMGYSAYLHPMGDDLLLGVGQDADELGRTKGLQLSLFDVSDPAAPDVLDQVDLTNGHSDVEHDHHAFLHWPATGLTAVPFQRWFDWGRDEPEDLGPMSGVLTFTASRDDGITETGMLSHVGPYLRDLGIEDAYAPEDGEDRYEFEDRVWRYQYETAIQRSMVIGDRLVTVSDVGVAVNDLDTLDERGWLTFEDPRR